MSDYISNYRPDLLTERINQVAFPVTTIYIASKDRSKFATVKNYETILLGVATGAYLSMLPLQIAQEKLNLRYLDWLITTPLLTSVIYEYAVAVNPKVREEIPQSYLVIPPILMIVTGYLARITCNPDLRNMYLLLSWIFLAFTLINIYRLSQLVDLKGAEWFFYILWPLYGVVFFVNNIHERSYYYNILDFLAKIVFAIYFTDVVLDSS